jgi:ferredoxin
MWRERFQYENKWFLSQNLSSITDDSDKSFFRKKDPLVYLGIVVLVIGLVLLAYGFVPVRQANYQLLPNSINVPLTNGKGQFISSDQAVAIAQPQFNGSVNSVVCQPSSAGYTCYGQQFIGWVIVTSNSAKEYGGAMVALGVTSFYLGYRYEPLTIKKRELHSIRIRVDEDICIANAVCVNLAPNVFQLKKQIGPTLLAPLVYIVDPNGATNDEILVAAQMCPTGAIIIEDAETGERIHPPLPTS